MSSGNSNLWWGRIKDVLTVLIVPAFIWVNDVSTNLQTQELEIISLKQEIKEVEDRAKTLTKEKNQIDKQVTKLETKLENIEDLNNEIRRLVLSFNK